MFYQKKLVMCNEQWHIKIWEGRETQQYGLLNIDTALAFSQRH